MEINGHIQVCTYATQCKHGSSDGCSYILDTNSSRLKEGLFIVDGKCPAFTPGRQRKKIQITFTKKGADK